MTLDRELQAACEACRRAGAILLRHAAGSREASIKSDGSPVTAADPEAEAAIRKILRSAFPSDLVLGEEGEDDPRRLGRERVWIVDPLDGTRDFVAGTGDYAVHVGLAVAGRPVVGAVLLPSRGQLYHAVSGAGAFVETEGGGRERLAVSRCGRLEECRLAISRMAPGEALLRLSRESGLDARAVRMGASTKFMAVARGEVDAALLLGGLEKEWDTCAPEVVLSEAGGKMTDVDGRPLTYNHADVLFTRGVVATNGALHDEICALARSHVPSGRLVISP